MRRVHAGAVRRFVTTLVSLLMLFAISFPALAIDGNCSGGG